MLHRSGLSKGYPVLPKGAKYPGGETVLLLTLERLHPAVSAKAQTDSVLSNRATHLPKQSKKAAFE